MVVQAAAGGTGSLAVQLAKRMGAGRVIGLASSEEKRELARRLGRRRRDRLAADDLEAAILEANGGEPVDVVLEMSGGEAFEASLRALAPFGRLVTYGLASREPDRGRNVDLMRTSRAGDRLLARPPVRPPAGASRGDRRAARRGGAKRARGGDRRRLPALGCARAHEDIAARRTQGKLLLDRADGDRAGDAFSELGLSDEILRALDELGYTEPTPIQEQAIPELLAGHDVIGQAQTGTGKTAAFGLPLLQYLDPGLDEAQALVLTPTRELCIQVTQALRAYAEHLAVEVVAVFGGPRSGPAVEAPRGRPRRRGHGGADDGPDVARLPRADGGALRRPRRGRRDARPRLHRGRREDPADVPVGRQTALFSATMPPPIARLAERYMYDPVTIKVTPKQLTVDAIEQAYVEVAPSDKIDRLVEVLKAEEPEQAIIFCRTKIGAARLDKTLRDRGPRGQGAARRHEPGLSATG